MAVITVRALDYSVIQSLTTKSPAQPFNFKRGTTPQVGVQFADETGNVKILDTYATAMRTFTGQPAAADTETVAGQVYTWEAALTGANQILIGANLAASIANYVGAVEAASAGGQAAGTTYGAATAANLYVSATAVGDTVTVTSLVIGSAGNSYTVSMAGASGAWSGANLAGGETAEIILGAKPANPSNTASGPGTPAYDGAYAINGSVYGPPDANGIYWIPVSFNNDALNELLGYDPPTINDDVSQVNLFAAVKTVVGSDIEESSQFTITVVHDINQGVQAALTSAAKVVAGTLVLGNGVNFGQVTGLALSAAPGQVLLTMNRNTGNLGLGVILRSNSKTTDGFIFDLIGGATDTADYSVDYLVLLPA